MNEVRPRPPCNIYIVTQGSPNPTRPLVGVGAGSAVPQAQRVGYDPLPPTPTCTRLDNGYRRCCITNPYDSTTHCAVLPPDSSDNSMSAATTAERLPSARAGYTSPPLFDVTGRRALGARPFAEGEDARHNGVRGAYDCRLVGTGPSGQLFLACSPE
ncbi:hypothetical protein pkur_cds_346 [Pandoravirus kuranda]|uniref:Uncharacterized protein n=1 Tax=Pandoravirus kuranda TaxID=3019033 RepID=A0AA95J7L8_9VIRU|nr:hypothetical protein pkur_cds_346 [Pandoravirus kuranda]